MLATSVATLPGLKYEGAHRHRAEFLRLRRERARIREAVRPDMHDSLQRRAACHLEPACRQCLPFGECERAALSRGAADEDMAHARGKEVGGLCFDNGEVQRAVGVKGRVGGCDEARDWGWDLHSTILTRSGANPGAKTTCSF
jgi:hypothetical protein